jgi:CheY-like chemotaxis protein
MDHMMPVMDGIEAVRVIRNEIDSDYARALPIIALTANAIAGNREMFLRNGFQDFLTKPIDVVQLNDAINIWVRDEEYERRFPDAVKRPGASVSGGVSASPLEESGLGKDAQFFLQHGVEGMNFAAGLARFGGKKIYIDALRSFVKNTPRLLEIMEKARDKNDIEEYRITVHGIKGSGYGISADVVGREAELLENAAKRPDIPFIAKRTDTFVFQVGQLIDALADVIALADNEDKKPVKNAPDRELLREILDAAKEYDITKIDAAMETLDDFSYESGGELISWLKTAYIRSDFEEIQARLEKELE